MKLRRTVIRLSGCLLLACALATLGCHAASRETSAITARDMRAHVEFLASDALEGRDAGRKSADVAAQYVEAQFKRLGLERVGDKWAMEFDLPDGAGEGTGEVRLGSQRFTGASVVAVPQCSATAELKARVVTSGAEQFSGQLVLVDGPPKRDERRVAEELLGKGAGGVIFVADKPWLDTETRSGLFGASAESPPGMPPVADSEGGNLADLSPEMRDQVESILAGMGIEASQGQVKIVVGGSALDAGESGGAVGGDGGVLFGNLPDGVETEVVTSGGGSFWSSAARLAGPVVRVSRPLGEKLRKAAEDEDQLTVRVTRPGRDQSSNVLAFVKGRDPKLQNEYVVIGAHYDHIGVTARGQVCHGADDNASGTAALLGVAQALATLPAKPMRSILLAAWGAEEHGLVGSRAFGRNPPVPLEQIVAYVNLDMVGRNDPHEIQIGNASETLNAWAVQAAQANGFTTKDIGGAFLGASDTSLFLQKKIPTVFFHSGLHADLHRPSDVADKVDADKIARASRAACAVVWRAANETQRPAFTAPRKGAGLFGGIEVGTPSGGRRLGIYPATGQGEGAQVGGVAPDSVAAKAGMKAGDRIIRIGDRRIEKFDQIPETLRALPAGQLFEIEVRRTGDGAEQTVILKGVFDEPSKEKK